MSWWYETTEEESKMEFDKSRCYSAVNADELKPGDKVIVSDCLRFLRQDVKEGGDIETLKEVLDESHLQRFKVMDDLEWGLAYLVERKENCTNCEKFKTGYCIDGWDVDAQKRFRCDDYEPKTEKKKPDCPTCKNREECDIVLGKNSDRTGCEEWEAEKHYRPFRDTDELIKVWREKSKQVHSEYSLTMPYIWVRRKEVNSKGQLITEFGDGWGVGIGRGEAYNMTDLLVHFTFLDGSVCGVEE